MPSASRRESEGEAIGAVGIVGADGGDQQADRQADQRVGERSAAQRHHAGEAEQQNSEIFRAKRSASAKLASGCVSSTMIVADSNATAKRRDQRPAKRLRRLALARHGVAVPQHRAHRSARPES